MNLVKIIFSFVFIIARISSVKPLPIFKIHVVEILDNDEIFFMVSDHHAAACMQFTGTNLANQLRTIPPGGRHVTVDQFLNYYKTLYDEDWCDLKNQSEALIGQLKRIQQNFDPE